MNHEVRAFKQALQGVHYDLVIDAQGLIKSGIISRLSRGLTIGLSNRTIREPLATLFYNKVYSVPWSEHAVDRVRQLFARALKYHYDKDSIDYGIDVSRIDSTLRPTTRKRVMFLHGTTWPTKHWPEEYWCQLAHIATEAGYEVVLPWGTESEKMRAQKISEGNANAIVLERQNLTGIAREIVQCSGVIGVDTGLGHLAAALEKPTVSLYGPTNPGLSGTCGKNQLHLNSNLNCAPCVKKVCGYTGPDISDNFSGKTFPVVPPCFSTHQPAAVWQKFTELVNS